MVTKKRKPAPLKVQAALTRPVERAQWKELRQQHGSDLAVIRWLLGYVAQKDEVMNASYTEEENIIEQDLAKNAH